MKEYFKKSKINNHIKHYIKEWRLLFDVRKEKGELLKKVSSVLFLKQSCIRKVKVRYSTGSVR